MPSFLGCVIKPFLFSLGTLALSSDTSAHSLHNLSPIDGSISCKDSFDYSGITKHNKLSPKLDNK